MNEEKKYLTCKRVKFYFQNDEAAFFEWIQKIHYIESFEGARDELYLDLREGEIPDNDLQELLALFYRYKISMSQLAVFLNENNKGWFYNKDAYWYKRVFKVT